MRALSHTHVLDLSDKPLKSKIPMTTTRMTRATVQRSKILCREFYREVSVARVRVNAPSYLAQLIERKSVVNEYGQELVSSTQATLICAMCAKCHTMRAIAGFVVG